MRDFKPAKTIDGPQKAADPKAGGDAGGRSSPNSGKQTVPFISENRKPRSNQC